MSHSYLRRRQFFSRLAEFEDRMREESSPSCEGESVDLSVTHSLVNVRIHAPLESLWMDGDISECNSHMDTEASIRPSPPPDEPISTTQEITFSIDQRGLPPYAYTNVPALGRSCDKFVEMDESGRCYKLRDVSKLANDLKELRENLGSAVSFILGVLDSVYMEKFQHSETDFLKRGLMLLERAQVAEWSNQRASNESRAISINCLGDMLSNKCNEQYIQAHERHKDRVLRSIIHMPSSIYSKNDLPQLSVGIMAIILKHVTSGKT